MTLSTHAHSRRARGSARAIRQPTVIAVDVLVCGSIDRGDGGAPILASRYLPDRTDREVRVRLVDQVGIDDLLAVSPGAGVVIVDTATGLRTGSLVTVPLDGLIGRDDNVRGRSSHALEYREVLGLADMIRGRPLRGRIVMVGGRRFGRAADVSPRVARAIPRLGDLVLAAIEELRR
jgi:hydrogenase maturation protease